MSNAAKNFDIVATRFEQHNYFHIIISFCIIIFIIQRNYFSVSN